MKMDSFWHSLTAPKINQARSSGRRNRAFPKNTLVKGLLRPLGTWIIPGLAIIGHHGLISHGSLIAISIIGRVRHGVIPSWNQVGIGQPILWVDGTNIIEGLGIGRWLLGGGRKLLGPLRQRCCQGHFSGRIHGAWVGCIGTGRTHHGTIRHSRTIPRHPATGLTTAGGLGTTDTTGRATQHRSESVVLADTDTATTTASTAAADAEAKRASRRHPFRNLSREGQSQTH